MIAMEADVAIGTMAFPAFSIVIPTYQRREIVCDALRAIARIDYPGRFEVVVVVDGSTDGTAAAIAGLGLRYPLQVIEQRNAGLAATRNRGAAAARGDIVLFLDDDMMCDPAILGQHAVAFAAGADGTIGEIPVDPASPPGLTCDNVGTMVRRRAERMGSGSELQLFDLLGGHLAVRRSLFERMGGFDEAYTQAGGYGHEDLDFGIRLLAAGTVRFCSDAIACQRYVVTPRQNLAQIRKAGFAAVRFACRNPDRADELFEPYGPTAIRTRWVFQPLCRVPGAVAALAWFTALAASRGYGRGPRLDRLVAGLYAMTSMVMFWAGVRQARQMPD